MEACFFIFTSIFFFSYFLLDQKSKQKIKAAFLSKLPGIGLIDLSILFYLFEFHS